MGLPVKTVCALLCLFPINMAGAQSDPQLHIRNPTGFISPGQWFEVHAELVNPVDSGIIIQRISGGGYSGGLIAYGNTWDPAALGESQLALLARIQGNPGAFYRAVAGEFPVHPGESVVFVLYEFQVPEDAQPGQEFLLKQIRAKMDTGDGFVTPNVYADLNVVRVVSADGRGDESLFEGMDLTNPQAGVLRTNLWVEFLYPREIIAGEPFTLEATISNLGDRALRLLLHAAPQFHSQQGEHARSYRYVPCREECQLAGEQRLRPGESVSWQLGTYYYENPDFFAGELRLEQFALSVVDHLQRHETVAVPAAPVRIAVQHQQGNERLFMAAESPPEPLELRDLYGPGDGLIVYDPNTGREWLKLTAGEGYSLDQILAEMGPGGRFEGFSLAGSRDVETLFLNHMNASGVPLREYALYQTVGDVAVLQGLVGLLGNIPTVNDTLGFNGIVNDDLPSRHTESAQYTIMEVSVTAAAPNRVFLMTSTQGLRKYRRDLVGSLHAYTGYWLMR